MGGNEKEREGEGEREGVQRTRICVSFDILFIYIKVMNILNYQQTVM